MLDRIIALVSLGIGILAWFSPYVWPKIPNWVAQLGVFLGVLLFGVAIGLFIAKRISDKVDELVDSAAIKFHFYGDARTPQRISANNIWRWYYLRNIISLVDASTGATSDTSISNLFVSFEKPVKIGTLHVSSPDIQIPRYEVKEFNNRFAIIVFSGEIPSGTLDLSVV